ncbi:integrator complex subunit 3-like protein [Dinothrombium tinctorium]|uniref:SOSS complex subunit A homolog n=1 Tax=Dinothrombium tinctorium TaxID=1965070 RepID=A0A3S3PWV2_9ACAR|nr:integrator complex subunit 3-like protein [Dinothrombium tinctorium]RWS09645.1 integrator complex subunit 3-like protein [Dinothrombium tinctorium]
MDANKNALINKLLNLSPIEAKDEIDENLINGVSESEAHDTLTATVCKSPVAHEEVCLGLLISILVDSQNAARYYRDLTYVSRDGLAFVISSLNLIILERYTKLSESTRSQLLWLLREMIKTSINGTDSLVYNLLRQIAGGDISPKNIWLAESLLDLLIENRLWLEKFNILVTTVVYTYLRLIVDHGSTLLTNLRQKEIDFCVSLLRERFSDCMCIGRDLVRLLQNVARIPEFEQLWRDIYDNPSSLAPGFQGVHQLMTTRTSRKFLQCRLTPDMEKKIVYLTSQVKFGQQKRYQEWFQRQYLSTPESQSLRCDLIRFICGVIHPSNEVLCSDIIPRWAIIGWILSSCTSNVAASNAKLSLFYDWLFYDPEKDNIMNIEPAILVMFHSLRSHPVITVTLLDFLCRIMTNFHPPLNAQIKQGINTSFHQILEKRVLPPKLDRELRLLLRESFPEFCSQSNDLALMQGGDIIITRDSPDIIIDAPNSNHNSEPEPRFSDDEVEIISPKKTRSVKEIFNNCHDKSVNEILPKADFDSLIEQFNEDIKSSLLSLLHEKDNEIRCQAMEKFIQAALQEEDFEQENPYKLVLCLIYSLQDEFTRQVYPQTVPPDDEAFEESIGTPLFVMFRNLCQTAEEDPNRVPILNILAEMSSHRRSIGYLLLYFMKVSKFQDNRMSAYRDYVKTLGKDLMTALLSDLRVCQEEDVKILCYLLPDIYSCFHSTVVNNAELLNLIVSCIDSTQLQDLICYILQGDMIMFKKDSFLSLLNASLEWETFEQFCLWQLIAAHNIPMEYVLPILPKLEFQTHAEALTNILLLLKRETPSQEVMKHIVNRDVKESDSFVVSVLKYWTQEHCDKLADLISGYLMKPNSTGKRKRQTGIKAQLSQNAEQLLMHLDQLRQKSKTLSFFNHEAIQNALTHVQSLCTEVQKTRFSDLFALAEDYDPKPVAKRGKTTKSRGKSKQVEDSNSDTDASEEETIPSKSTKQPISRKKRKALVNSDSD